MINRPPFGDRVEAGQLLARALIHYANRPNAVVLALPRGGVPVGYEIARALALPLDVLIVRKLGVPGHEELAMGAIASGGVRVLYNEVIQDLGIADKAIEAVAARERRELERREHVYRDHRPVLEVHDRIVLLVDDGLATGTTMLAAIKALRARHPAGIVVGVPVAPPSTVSTIRREVDEIVCLLTPELFYGVGLWYADFHQVTDDEVRSLLDRAEHAQHNEVGGPGSGARSQ
ncbi:MAG TPA: phosphoribosyltransferase [Herpetosiphonaceae bacterium]